MDNFKVSLAAARLNAGLSQKEAAEKLGITQKCLQGWESGKHKFKKYEMIAISIIYECPEDHIFFGSTIR